MTIAQIKYFIAVAKCLSFTKAAEQLFITQPALSRHIRNMEEELNIQLFVRTGSGIYLTPAGISLFEGFSSIYESYTGQVARAEKIQAGLSGRLKIGVLSQTNIADFMPLIYHDFQKNHPNVDLWFTQGSFSSLLDGLYAGDLDLVFTLQFEIERKKSIVYQYVDHSRDHIVLSRYHPLAAREDLVLEDLKDEKFVMISPEDNPESSGLVFDLCKKHGFVPQAVYATSLEEQILWIEAGIGVTILDSRCELKNNREVKFYEMDSNWDPSLVLCWNQHNYNPLIAVFLQKMNEVLGLEDEEIHGIEE